MTHWEELQKDFQVGRSLAEPAANRLVADEGEKLQKLGKVWEYYDTVCCGRERHYPVKLTGGLRL